jgi:hypothetical protein
LPKQLGKCEALYENTYDREDSDVSEYDVSTANVIGDIDVSIEFNMAIAIDRPVTIELHTGRYTPVQGLGVYRMTIHKGEHTYGMCVGDG